MWLCPEVCPLALGCANGLVCLREPVSPLLGLTVSQVEVMMTHPAPHQGDRMSEKRHMTEPPGCQEGGGASHPDRCLRPPCCGPSWVTRLRGGPEEWPDAGREPARGATETRRWTAGMGKLAAGYL